jgi:polyribonucleotide nucleotidyltransferase
MQRETNTTIVIEEKGNFGVIDIVSANKDSIELAKARIRAIVAVPEIGEIYLGTVKSLMPFGAFVEILPGKDGLLHISEIEWRRLETVEGVLKAGDKIKVKLIGVDAKTNKMKLSRKVLLPKPEGYQEERPSEPRSEYRSEHRSDNRSEHRSDNRPPRNRDRN